MGFEGLTSGERKRLQQGILKPEEAALVSARAIAKGGGGGFWTSTWGQVLRGVGIAALNFIPVVGSVASAGVGAYDKQRFAELQKKSVAEYNASAAALVEQKRQEAQRNVPAPVLETSEYPWIPDFGSIYSAPGYTGGVVTAQGGPMPMSEQLQDAVAELQPYAWWIVGAIIAVVLVSMLLRRRR